MAQGEYARHHERRRPKADSGSDASAKGLPRLGLTLAPAKEVAGSGDQGLAVVEVDLSGPAAERGVKTGDVILDVGGARDGVDTRGMRENLVLRAECRGRVLNYHEA